MSTDIDKLLLQGEGSFIMCRNSNRKTVRGTLLKIRKYSATFEVYDPYGVLCVSEVLSDFHVVVGENRVYSGHAVVSSIINTGILLVCEASLQEELWLDSDPFSKFFQEDKIQQEFIQFQKNKLSDREKVIPEFKAVVSDMRTLFEELRNWLEQLEIAINHGSSDRLKTEREAIENIRAPMLTAIENSFLIFEKLAETLPKTNMPYYNSYVKKQLHALLLCSPFVSRVFHKPLGYAGDYGVVNMILQDPLKGSSIFAKVVNLFFLTRTPAQGHRNRISYLTKKIREETRRVIKLERKARILTIGCGPAGEIQNFLIQDDLCEKAEITLYDFDDEVIEETGKTLQRVRSECNRGTSIKIAKKSVQQLVKENAGKRNSDARYDFVYCAGLFDYLSDRLCKRLMNIFFNLLNPGGLVISTNVCKGSIGKNSMELILEWHLVYRDRKEMRSLAPDLARKRYFVVDSDMTGANLFFEIRKA